MHVLEHLSFLLAGSLYWWHLISPIRARMRLGGMGPIAYMASSKLFVGALGMGLAFAPSALYPYYEHHARVWGLSALDDQAIAGMIMAVEQSLVMGIALVVLFIARARRVRARAAAPRALRRPRVLTPPLPVAPAAARELHAQPLEQLLHLGLAFGVVPVEQGAQSSSRRALRIWSAIAVPAGVRRASGPSPRSARARAARAAPARSAPPGFPTERAISERARDAVAAETRQRPGRAGRDVDSRPRRHRAPELAPALLARGDAQRPVDLRQRARAPSAPPASPRGPLLVAAVVRSGRSRSRRLSTKPTAPTPAADEEHRMQRVHVGVLVGDPRGGGREPLTCAPVSRPPPTTCAPSGP